MLLSASVFLLIDCSKHHPSPSTSSGNWVSKSQLQGLSRYGASSWVIGDTGYLVGGFNAAADSCLSDLWQFDPVKSVWVQKAYFPGGARLSAIAFVIGANGYLATGISDVGQIYKDCWQYNPGTNTWTKMADLPDANMAGSGARYDAVAFAIGNNGYVGTGIGINGIYLTDFWKFDPVANSWASVSNCPSVKRAGAVAFTTFNDTAAYLVTGTDGNNELTDFWKYSPYSGWTRLRDITNSDQTDNYDDDYTDIARDHAVALVQPSNGVWKAYITTGKSSSVLNDKTWEYDFAADKWTRKTPFSEGGIRSARSQAVAWSFINMKRGFIGTGGSGMKVVNNVETAMSSFDDVAEWFPANTEDVVD